MADVKTPQTKLEEDLEKKLGQIHTRGSEDTYQAQAQKLGIPFSDLNGAPIDTAALALIPEEIARSENLAAILKNGTELTIVSTHPENVANSQTIKDLEARGFKIQVLMTSPSGLARAWERYSNLKHVDTFEVGSINIKEEDIAELQSKIGSIKDLQQQVNSVS